MNKYNEFLKQFCGEAYNSKFNLSKPWLENNTLCATNGHFACAIKAELCDVGEMSDIHPKIDRIRQSSSDDFADFQAKDLHPTDADIKRLTPKKEKCDECLRGTVTCNFDHEHECPECDGSGFVVVAEIKHIGFQGRTYNWNYFKPVLEAADEFGDGKFQCSIKDSNNNYPMARFKIGADIEIFVMPVVDTRDTPKIVLGKRDAAIQLGESVRMEKN